mgnify:CR=1 FL=1
MMEPLALSMITWPAVLNYDGDDELIYIESEQAWLRDAASLLYHHSGNDQLIDSSGHVYRLDAVSGSTVIAAYTKVQMTVAAFIKLVRIHASNSHRCCIDKINFRTIADGIQLVDSMSET